MNKRKFGIIGEKIAQKYLKDNKYEIIENNYYTRNGEIDIIASKNNYIIFVEVKTRTNEKYGKPSEAVNNIKKTKLKNIGLLYMDKLRLYDYNLRFDIIECYWQIKKINHIINAF